MKVALTKKIVKLQLPAHQKFTSKFLRFGRVLCRLKVTLCKLQLSHWAWPDMGEFAEQDLMLLFVSLSKRTFSQEIRVHKKRKGVKHGTGASIGMQENGM